MGNSQDKPPPKVDYVDRTAELRREAEERQRTEMRQQHEVKSQKNEELAPRRKSLTSYKFGGMNGMGAFKEFDISDMEKSGALRIGLFGPAGAGKSSFIYSCERTIKQIIRGTADVKIAKGEGTIRIGDYLAGPWHFKLVDTRGFGDFAQGEIIAFSDIIYGNVTEGQIVNFEKKTGSKTKGETQHWIHSVVFVLSATDPALQNDDLKDYLGPFRAFMRPKGIAPITIITHKDELISRGKGSEVKDIMAKASIATGSAMQHTFCITNYIGTEEQNPDIELGICEVLEFALSMGERYVKFIKHDEKTTTTRLGRLTIDAKSIRNFFKELQEEHSLSEDRVNNVIDELEGNGIHTVTALKTSWSTVKQRVVLSSAMKRHIEEKLM